MVRFGDPTPELAVDLHDVYLLDGMRDGDRNFYTPHKVVGTAIFNICLLYTSDAADEL